MEAQDGVGLRRRKKAYPYNMRKRKGKEEKDAFRITELLVKRNSQPINSSPITRYIL